MKMHEAISLAREPLHPFSLAWALNFTARLHELRREGQAAAEQADAVIALATEQGFANWLAWETVMRGWALTAQGHAQTGMAEIRKGIAAIRATGTEIARSHDLGVLAEAQQSVGQIEDGLATVAEAFAFVEQTDERHFEAELYRLKGSLILQTQATSPRADLEKDADACFQRAIEIAKNQQAKSFELRASSCLARLWQQQNKKAEAKRLLMEIYHWFSEGFDIIDLQQAKALLDELG